MKLITTFGQRAEFEKARRRLETLGLPYESISPDPGYARVGQPSLVLTLETRLALAAGGGDDFLCAGWIEYRPARIAVPADPPPAYAQDLLGETAIMVLVPCVADKSRIRFIAHIEGNLAPVLPYLNAEMPEATYNPKGETLTFMDRYRLVTLYPHRIVVAKADEIVDGWRTLEQIRRRANETWARRAAITPCHQMREKPPALEVFKRLPGTNCRACGQQTCLAFAIMVHEGEVPPTKCRPVFEGEFGHLREALVEICTAIGVMPEEHRGHGQNSGPRPSA
jgi:ArsR family metal-binding transcriptional regulator